MTSRAVVGRRIRAALSLAGRSVEDVAQELGVSSKTLSRTMRGQRAASPAESERLAEILDVPVAFLDRGFDETGVLSDSPAAVAIRLREVRSLRRALEREERSLANFLGGQDGAGE